MKPTRVQIREIPANDRSEVINGKRYLRGRTLASYVKEFDGFEGEVIQPTTGERFSISLEAWRDRDPASTWLEVMFISESPRR